MPGKTRADIQRTVFVTTIQPDAAQNKWNDFGALQVGVGDGDNGQKIHVVLYRVRHGSIYDISDAVQFANDTMSLAPDALHSLPEPVVADFKTGFTIHLQALGTANASFTGTVGQASNWTGSFCGFDPLPLATIQAGKQPIPADVQALLDASPIRAVENNVIDQAKNWAGGVLQDLILHAYSADATKDFFANLQPLGTYFANKYLPNKTLPPELKLLEGGHALSLPEILEKNRVLLQIAGLHLLCQGLKQCHWLEQDAKDRVSDKVFAYFDLITCPDDAVPAKTAAYGSQSAVADSVVGQRRQWVDVATRCYLVAWACMTPSLGMYGFNGTAASLYASTKSTVLSDNYKAHWIASTIDAATDSRSQLFGFTLATLHDKLVLLRLLGGESVGGPGWPAIAAEINDIIAQQKLAARNTGLFGVTNFNVPADSFRLDNPIGNVMSDWEMMRLQPIDFSKFDMGRAHIGDIPIDYRSWEAELFLDKEAAPLGLWRKIEPESVSKKLCTIL